jgi:hypothetical protein
MSSLDGEAGCLMPGASEWSQRVEVLNANWTAPLTTGTGAAAGNL